MTPSAPAIPDNSNGDAYEKCFPDCDHPVAEGSLCSVCLGKRRIGSLPNSTPAVEILIGSTWADRGEVLTVSAIDCSGRWPIHCGPDKQFSVAYFLENFKPLSNPASPPVDLEPAIDSEWEARGNGLHFVVIERAPGHVSYRPKSGKIVYRDSLENFLRNFVKVEPQKPHVCFWVGGNDCTYCRDCGKNKPPEEFMIDSTDLSEMRWHAHAAHRSGFKSIRIDPDHAAALFGELLEFRAQKQPSRVAAQGEQNGKRIEPVNSGLETLSDRNHGRHDDGTLSAGVPNRGSGEEPEEVSRAGAGHHEASRSVDVGQRGEPQERVAPPSQPASSAGGFMPRGESTSLVGECSMVGATKLSTGEWVDISHSVPEQPAALGGEPYLPAVGETVRVDEVHSMMPTNGIKAGDVFTVGVVHESGSDSTKLFICVHPAGRDGGAWCRVSPVTPDKERADDASQQDSSGSQETGSRELARGAGMPPAAATSGGPDETIAELTLQRDEARAVIDRALFELGEHSQAISLPAAIRALRSQLTQAQSDLAEAKAELIAERDDLIRSTEHELARTRRLLNDERAYNELERNPGDDICFAVAPPEPIATKVEPGTTLEVGATYKVTELAPWDDTPRLEWTAEERDAHYSKLPGDQRLVAGLDPLPPPPLETWRNIHTGQVGSITREGSATIDFEVERPELTVWGVDAFRAAHERVKA